MIYFDNSATSYPKPASVRHAVNNAMYRYSFNSGRGGYSSSIKTAEKIFEVRQRVADLVSCEAENVAFTQNCTLALNMAIKGCVKEGEHIIISPLEHNAVARTVYNLKLYKNVNLDIADFSTDREVLLNNFRSLINDNTRAVVCMAASNVFGCVFPISEIGRLCHDNGIIFIVDGAQGIGQLDINMKRDNINILCGAGHKSLYGPMGTGFIAVNEIGLNTIIQGGTGSESTNLLQPDFMPDMLESGTLNNSGIIGLGAGIDYINEAGIDKIYNYELELSQYLYEELNKTEGASLYTDKPSSGLYVPIISFNYDDYSSERTASLLAEHGIATRAGYHCSPLAHRAFGTMDRGTVRISLSSFNNLHECEKFINYLKKLP